MIEFKKYQKQPLIINAIQITSENICELAARFSFGLKFDSNDCAQAYIAIYTLEGSMIGNIGDYLIQGIKSEFYPCKESIFLESYKEVE